MATTAATATTEYVAEDIAKNIAEITGAAKTATAHIGIHTRMAILVIGRALCAVHQDIVGLGGFLEFVLGIGIVRIAVRVVLHCHPAIGLFDFLVVDTLVDTQNIVIIAF